MNEIAAVDRRVKERLIGATVLVALLIIVAPELLPGSRPPRPTPTERAEGTPIELRLDTATSRATPTVQPEASAPNGADAGSSEPDPMAAVPTDESPPPSSAPASAPAPTSAPAPETARAPARSSAPARPNAPAAPMPRDDLEAAPAAPISKGSGDLAHASRAWAVQLGSFASRANAERLLHRLKSSGTSAYLLTTGSGTRVRYRVRVGPLADRSAAERTRARLKAAGHLGTLVPPGGAG